MTVNPVSNTSKNNPKKTKNQPKKNKKPTQKKQKTNPKKTKKQRFLKLVMYDYNLRTKYIDNEPVAYLHSSHLLYSLLYLYGLCCMDYTYEPVSLLVRTHTST
jgi:hypothetical protein